MARQRTLTVGALNIRIHPHDGSRYAALLRDTFDLRLSARVFGNQAIVFERIERSRSYNQTISGSLAKFTEIDPNSPWFNAERFERADDNEIAKIAIPQELRPNYASFLFEFDLAQHLLVFERHSASGDLSPRAALIFFEHVFSSSSIRQEYGSVGVSVVADHEKLEQILSIFRLTRLEILVKRPNPDDLGGYDAVIDQRLGEQRARSVNITYEADANEAFKPDEQTKAAANSATRNGRVKASGKDQVGRRVERSTEDHPALERVRYDPAESTTQDAFTSASSKFLPRLRSRSK